MTTCRGCGNEEAYHKRTLWSSQNDFDEVCDRCGNLPEVHAGVPDAYFKFAGQKFENLTDDAGHPIPIMSKRHKAEVMRQKGVSEAGDLVHGSRYSPSTSWIEGTRAHRRAQFDKHRPALRQILKAYHEKRG